MDSVYDECPFCDSKQQLDYILNKVNTLEAKVEAQNDELRMLNNEIFMLSAETRTLNHEIKQKTDLYFKRDLITFSILCAICVLSF